MVCFNSSSTIDMNIEYIPFTYFKKSSLVNAILSNKDDNKFLADVLQNNLDKPNNYPILLTFLRDINNYYKTMINHLMEELTKEMREATCYVNGNVFRTYWYLTYIFTAILDNNNVEYKFKAALIKAIYYTVCHKSKIAPGLVYSSFLEWIYEHRKTNSIPLIGVELMFQQVNFSFGDDKYSVTNFMMEDTFLQYLTEREIDKCMPILLKKRGINQWLRVINVGSYMWLLSKLAKFLPYSFTANKLLPACKDKFNIGLIPILLKMNHLREQDRNWLESFALIKKLL